MKLYLYKQISFFFFARLILIKFLLFLIINNHFYNFHKLLSVFFCGGWMAIKVSLSCLLHHSETWFGFGLDFVTLQDQQ